MVRQENMLLHVSLKKLIWTKQGLIDCYVILSASMGSSVVDFMSLLPKRLLHTILTETCPWIMRNWSWKSLSSPWKKVIWGLHEPSVKPSWPKKQLWLLCLFQAFSYLAHRAKKRGSKIKEREAWSKSVRTFSPLSPPRFSPFFSCCAPTNWTPGRG